MAKDSFYFSHDYNARNDPKILELRSEYGMEGYGIYWCLIETMAEDDEGVVIATLIGGLSVGYGVPKNRLLEIIQFMIKIGLLHQDNDEIYSLRLREHKNMRKALSDKGKEGAEKRWENERKRKKNGPPNSPPNGPPNAKERKGKERKEYSTSIECNEVIIDSNSIDKKNIEVSILNTEVKEETKKDSKKKTQKEKLPKIEFAENVLLTQAEYDKLSAQCGAENIDGIIQYFSLAKCAKGYKYISDYHAILKWAINGYYEEKQKYEKQYGNKQRSLIEKLNSANDLIDRMYEGKEST